MRSAKTDQPGHPPSLISIRCELNWVAKDPSFLHAGSEVSDQTEISLGAHAIFYFFLVGGRGGVLVGGGVYVERRLS